MVNLRYYIVSLVGVFLALAVGVILGAGPLQNRINSIAEGQNDAQALASLENEVAESRAHIESRDLFLETLGIEVVADRLSGYAVATVSLPGVSQDELASITRALTDAGATVVGNVELTEAWGASGQREYRDTLAGPVASHLAGEPTTNAGGDVLAQALVEVLTTETAETALVKDILCDETTALVVADSFPADLATALVFVGPESVSMAVGQENAEEGVLDTAMLVALANAGEKAPQGAVAVGVGMEEDDFISVLRAAGVNIPTVDQAGTPMAAINVVLALPGGGSDAYGQQEGAKEPVAPIP